MIVSCKFMDFNIAITNIEVALFETNKPTQLTEI